MSFLDKILSAVKLNDDYDEDDEFFDEEDSFDEEPAPKKKKPFFKKLDDDDEDDFDDEPAPAPAKTRAEKKAEKAAEKEAKAQAKAAAKNNAAPKTGNKITAVNTNRTIVANMEVCVIKPTSMEDSQEIADTLLDGCTVILNLEGLDVEIAQRIIDFAMGACYSIKGNLKKISSYIFIMTPTEVAVSGDYQQLLNSFDMPSIRTSF